MKKLCIVVPYRDREEHLNKFIPYMEKYMETYEDADYEIVIVEQADKKPFNRAKLLNIGYLENKGFDYFIFHDVDMLPEDSDYDYEEKPTHLSSMVEQFDYRLPYDGYFGGVTLFDKESFEQINGYSNEYWGWGAEDDDVLLRCSTMGIPIFTKAFGIDDESYNLNYFYFNGIDSFISIPFEKMKPIMLDDFSISIKFKPDDVVTDVNREYDEYTVFCIPGFNFSLSFNSFNRYKLEMWNNEEKSKSIVTDINPEMWVHAVITRNSRNKMIELYINNEYIGGEFIEDLYNKRL